ncbi:hypothetical protein E0H26_16680 [Micromonospora zingiberis]|uniref:Uncharacterized protein n=1 Tax=Micromonospora zingiberis TaxID=2053011 RepID=A0A4V2LWE5_9ACTN|nr:hypothetical protein [Micromonospora zingiberis]TCB96245.1 hypothetical protein E0H26_16680 [Micromonospora zingiberis]
MNHRILPAVLLLTAALAACGGDPERSPVADPTAPSAASVVPQPPHGPEGPAAPTPVEPSTAAPVEPSGAAPARPSAEGSPQRLPPSPPPVELPPRQAGAPSAREVVAAFRAAGLKATNSRDRSVDCGPDGLGLGCSELVVTDGVAVYVFPDESSAGDLAERWTGAAYRSGTVVLNYLEAPTPKADRPRYEKVLAGLR